MTPRDEMLIEIEISHNQLCKAFLNLFGPHTPQRMRDQFMISSAVPDGDINRIGEAVKRTANWMKHYQSNVSSNYSEDMAIIIKSIQQLGSIYQIGFSYPEKATNRAKKIRPQTVLIKPDKERKND